MAEIIDGRKLAQTIVAKLKQTIAVLNKKRPPGLATILVGDNPASQIYVANKRAKAREIGIKSFHYQMSEDTQETDLLALIDELNNNHAVDGILVQLPLPKHISEMRVLERVVAKKDVDGFHPLNLGHLLRGEPTIVACTPLGVIELIDSIGYDVLGKYAVVVGKSTIVGKPMAHLLLQREATVTICHKLTRNLAEITKQADLIVVAAGSRNLITSAHVKPGAVVIDVGINRDQNNRIVGDVDFDAVKEIASYITPVPGGVGPMTIAMLLKNTVDNFVRS